MGRPPSVTFEKKHYLISYVRPFTNSGGYIPMPQKYVGKRVVIRIVRDQK